MLCFVRAAARARRPRALAAFALSGALALLTHYFAVFLLVPMALWLLREPSAAARRRSPAIGGARRRRPGAAAADLRPGRARHAVDRALGVVRAACRRSRSTSSPATPGEPLGHGIELLVALPMLAGAGARRTLARCSAEPRAMRAEPATRGNCVGARMIALLIAACGVLLPIVLAVVRRGLPGAAQPRRRDDPAERADRAAARRCRSTPAAAGRGARVAARSTRAARSSPFLAIYRRRRPQPAPAARRLARRRARARARARGARAITTVELGAAPLEYYLPRCAAQPRPSYERRA